MRGLGAGTALAVTQPWRFVRAQEPDGVLLGLEEFAPSYFRNAIPRGVRLSFDSDAHTTRAVTWLTTGAEDRNTYVEYGVVPQQASVDEIAQSGFLNRQLTGTSALAPFGFGDPADVEDDPSSFLSPLRPPGPGRPDERPVRVHRAR